VAPTAPTEEGFMKASTCKGRTVAFLLGAILTMAGVSRAHDAGWPRTLNNGCREIVVYQPQPDSLQGTTLQSRVCGLY
jgi:hypothetical protein